MQSYFTSDLHLGHKAIPKYRDCISSSAENTELMLEKLSTLTKRDMLWILGDFLFDHPDYDSIVSKIQSMPFQLKLVMGNHDSLNLYRDFASSIQLPLFSYKNRWVSHCPIHPQELRGRLGNIHGHLHSEHIHNDPRYFNVNIDVNDYNFVPVEHINSHFQGIQCN